MAHEKFVVSPFQRTMYARWHEEAARARGDAPSRRTLDDIVDIVKVEYHDYNGGDYVRSYVGRFITKAVRGDVTEYVAHVVNRMNGTYERRTVRTDAPGTLLCNGPLKIADLMGDFAAVTELYRICEILDARTASHFMHAFGTRLIANALGKPQGEGYPEFTRGMAQTLLARYREAPAATESGPALNVRTGGWYATARTIGHCDVRRDIDPDTVVFTIGKAGRLSENRGRYYDETESYEVLCANLGFGPAVPRRFYLCGSIWLSAGEKLIPLTDDDIAELRRHANWVFPDTSAVLRDLVAAK